MNKKLHEPDLTDKASARLTTKQLIGAAHHAARYLPKASGELVTELASRLDVTKSALCESLKIRDVLASENGQMLRLLTDISENHGEFVNEEDEYIYASVPLDYVSEVNMYVSRDVNAENPFKETDAFLAEVQAQGVESAGEYLRQYAQSLHEEARLVLQDAAELCNGFAAQLRGKSDGGAL
ncbi:hypothetical protein [Atlantibacter hermannii]|uniref:hypothetical protein n=1 Tax=Atlantibacter hermannii TaxID=565 RepID=UPI000695BCED|nr:hypothetical protein [Atlantibacter hermannii]